MTRRVPVSVGQGNTLPPAVRLMTVKEVALACQLSEKAVRRAIDDGELAAIKLRSRLRVTPDDFRAWITSQRQRRARFIDRDPPGRRRRPAPAGTFRALLPIDSAERGSAS